MTSPGPQTQPPQQPAPPQAGTQTAETRAPEPQQAPAERPEEKRTGGKLLQFRTAHARVPIPYVTPGDMFSDARKGAPASTATSLLPSPRKLAFYGLLGAMAVVEAVEWPIAVAVGAATEVITREQAARQRAEHERIERGRAERDQGRQVATERTEPGGPAQPAMA
ncbi:hypothetical protein DIZ27_07070 [Streptomyces sp. NWU339]|uniref:hypothetical protein n=1 Tax=Streptomyces sp. NWU339 TaxID=2185284 RepID=UPI000D674CEB|nr:hypothetical protein [Streptomyces sp. NWU339]PWI11157.1 hypothetical protein DIZ27_07070 [Streptomyces sp. NWU339]